MAGQQGQPKYGFGWPDGRLGGLGPPGQREARPLTLLSNNKSNISVIMLAGCFEREFIYFIYFYLFYLYSTYRARYSQLNVL